MGISWTDEQKSVINSRHGNLLVSAAAGSGKTAVLVERIIRRLLDQIAPVDITEMLVVTFTNAAAGEMRQRIVEALGKAAREDPALGEQVMALFRELNDEGRTIVMITHDLKIARHASRIVNILDGVLSEGVSAYD